jgi:O-antigen ligase
VSDGGVAITPKTPRIGVGCIVANKVPLETNTLLLLFWQGYTIFKDMMRTIKTHVEYVFFFVLLFGLTLFGDGKQPIIDVIAGAGILCMVVISFLKGQRLASPAPQARYAWGGLLAYLMIRTVVSDSVGYSISSLFRWCMAYGVFVLFSSLAREKNEDVFRRVVVWFGLSVIALSWLYSAVPSLGNALSGMNLLYPTYGHNHVANIIVFLFPLALHMWLTKKHRVYLGMVLVVLGGLVVSFARGAWLLIGGYIVTAVFLYKNMSVWVKTCLISLTIVVVSVVVFFGVFHGASSDIHDADVLTRLTIKPPVLESRLPYWQQAVQAIEDRPVFGAGPGTFYLLSKRFQQEEQTHSWFAHSLPLELMAELGMVGFVGVVFLLWVLFSRLSRGPLFVSVVLTLAYSLYEINGNFLVIWLLFWASVGVLYSAEGIQKSPMIRRFDFVFIFSIGFVAIVYCSSVAAAALSVFSNTAHLAVYAEPHVVGRAVTTLEKNETTITQVNILSMLYAKDPEVQRVIAEYFDARNNIPSATKHYVLAIDLDPKNTTLRQRYIAFLLKHGLHEAAFERIVLEGKLWTNHADVLRDISYVTGSVTTKNSSELLNGLNGRWDDVLFAKTFYILGLPHVQTAPHVADAYWSISQRMASTWNYFYLERAALAKHVLQDEKKVTDIVQMCIEVLPSDPHCAGLKYDTTWLLPPGLYKKAIQAM